MSYSTENAKDNASRNMFVVVRPKLRVTSWTLHSGSVYYNDFSYGYVTAVMVDGVALTAGSSGSLSAGEFYYDSSAGRLYIRKTSGTPSGSDWIVATFELYFATKETYWYRKPTDSATTEVFWPGSILNAPTVTRSSSDVIFGFIPTNASGFSVANEASYLQPLLHDGSFYNAEVLIYHSAGTLSTSNAQQIYGGFCGGVSFNDSELSFSLIDKSYRLNEKWSNGAYNDRFANADPQYTRTFIRTSLGTGSSHSIGVNSDYNASSPTTSNNRKWSFTSAASGALSFDITATTINTTTEFVLNSTDIKKLKVGDKIYRNAAGYDSAIVNIFFNTGIVTFSAAPTLSGNTFTVIGVIDVRLVQGTSVYTLLNGRDYVDAYHSADGTYGITLTSSAEANVGASTIAPNNGDYVVGYIRPPEVNPTVGGSSLYAGSNYWNNPIVILYHVLKDRMGFAEADIDTSTFSSLASSIRLKGDFMPLFNLTVPDILGDEPPTYGEVIGKILSGCLLRMFVNNSGQFTLSQLENFSTADLSITDGDLIQPSYSYDYSNSGSVNVFSSPIEIVVGYVKHGGGFIPENLESLRYPFETVNGSANSYLYGSEFVRDVNCQLTGALNTTTTTFNGTTEYNFTATYGESTFALQKRRYGQLIAERRGRLACKIKAGAHNLELGDFVTVSRSRQPGFAYAANTLSDRNYVVVEVTKGLGGVDFILDDQKGIEDNSGDW